jgi:hypothetical protein
MAEAEAAKAAMAAMMNCILMVLGWWWLGKKGEGLNYWIGCWSECKTEVEVGWIDWLVRVDGEREAFSMAIGRVLIYQVAMVNWVSVRIDTWRKPHPQPARPLIASTQAQILANFVEEAPGLDS